MAKQKNPEAAGALNPAEALAQWSAYGEQQRVRAEAAELEASNLRALVAGLELRLKEAELPKRIYCFGRPDEVQICQRVKASSEVAARAQLAPGSEALQFRGCQG